MAEVWLNSGLPQDICEKYPEVRDFGIYRKLNNGKYEFLSYCKEDVQKYFSMKDAKFNYFLDACLSQKRD